MNTLYNEEQIVDALLARFSSRISLHQDNPANSTMNLHVAVAASSLLVSRSDVGKIKQLSVDLFLNLFVCSLDHVVVVLGDAKR